MMSSSSFSDLDNRSTKVIDFWVTSFQRRILLLNELVILIQP